LESWALRFFLGKYRLLKELGAYSFESYICAPRFRFATPYHAAALYSLCWANDGMIWLWSARSDVTTGLWEINRGSGFATVTSRLAACRLVIYQEVVLNQKDGMKSRAR
jgi:hypothetical protein